MSSLSAYALGFMRLCRRYDPCCAAQRDLIEGAQTREPRLQRDERANFLLAPQISLHNDQNCLVCGTHGCVMSNNLGGTKREAIK